MKPESQERYSRQVLFNGIGSYGQERLLESRVVIVGCGATGSAVASILARAGVGYLRIIDRDFVESSNLQRQTLFDENDARESLPKAIAAVAKIASFNSDVKAEASVSDLRPENVTTLLADAQLVMDGSDNFETRYLINDYSVQNAVIRSNRPRFIDPTSACDPCMYEKRYSVLSAHSSTRFITFSGVNPKCSWSWA